MFRAGLETARQVAHAHHATINAVVLAAVAGGLRAMLSCRGEDVHTLTLRATVPTGPQYAEPGSRSPHDRVHCPAELAEGPVDAVALGLVPQAGQLRRGGDPRPGWTAPPA